MSLMVEDILAPLVRHLRAATGIQALLTTIPDEGFNPVLGPPSEILKPDGSMGPYEGSPAPWIFRGFALDGTPSAHVEGTGSCAITLEQGMPWTSKTHGKFLEFPTIEVYYHCDPTRDREIGAPLTYDARDKCLTLHKQVSRVLHMVSRGAGGFNMWGAMPDGSGALRVGTSYESRGLAITPIPGGDGMVEGKATFDLEVYL